MPDTKIEQIQPHEWIDVDDPSVVHKVRRLARQHRRNRLANSSTTPVKTKAPLTFAGSHPPILPSTSPAYSPWNSTTFQMAPAIIFTSLQKKLYDRLTTKQGVDQADAQDIVLNNGYNKAASYGHMRKAGATHSEAKIVVDFDNPALSLAYGLARGRGLNHTDALAEALLDDND